MRPGTAHLPLHGGKAPRWLLSRMVVLSREILREAVDRAKVEDREKLAALKRLARHTSG